MPRMKIALSNATEAATPNLKGLSDVHTYYPSPDELAKVREKYPVRSK